MDTSPTIATLVVAVPLTEKEARARVGELFPNSESVLEASLFYRQTVELVGELSTFFISAYRDQNNFTLIIHFQQEDDAPSGRTLSRFEIRVEPGFGVDIRKAAEEVWHRFSHARHLLCDGMRPQLFKAAISSGGPDIITGRALTSATLITSSSELRLPVLVGTMSVATLIVVLLLGLVPATQLPAAWWAMAQLVVPALAAIGVAALSNRSKGISWRIE